MDDIRDLMTGPWSGLVIAVAIAILGPLLGNPAQRWLGRNAEQGDPLVQQGSSHGNNGIITQKGNKNTAVLDQRRYDQSVNHHHHHHGDNSSNSDGDGLGLLAAIGVLSFAALVAIATAFAHFGTTPLSVATGVATGFLALTWCLNRKSVTRASTFVQNRKTLVTVAIALILCWYTIFTTERTTYQGATFGSARAHVGHAWLFDAWSELTITERWLLGDDAVGNVFAIGAALLSILGLSALLAAISDERTGGATGWVRKLSGWRVSGFGVRITIIAVAALGLCLANGLLIIPIRNLVHYSNTIGAHTTPTPIANIQH